MLPSANPRSADLADSDTSATFARQPYGFRGAETCRARRATWSQLLQTQSDLEVLPIWRGQCLLDRDGEGPVRLPVSQAQALFEAADELGAVDLQDGRPVIALDLSTWEYEDLFAVAETRGPAPLGDPSVASVRGARALLEAAVTLLSWHSRHHFCSTCGAETVSSDLGRTRACTECGAVSQLQRCLAVEISLVHASTLASALQQSSAAEEATPPILGFVKPDETFEDAVRRTVMQVLGREPDGIGYGGSHLRPPPWGLATRFVVTVPRMD